MDKVIDLNFLVKWQSPIFVRNGNGMRERIGGPDAALAAPLHRWPSSSQSEYGIAKRRCVDAIARHGSARSASVESAVSAKVLA